MKGLELPFSAVIGGFFTLTMVVFLYLIFVARVYEIHVDVQRFDADIRTINLAQILLSHENLTYVKDGAIQRGVFSKGKLNKEMGTKIAPIDQKSINVWYPGFVAIITIRDGITGEKWAALIYPPTSAGTTLDDVLNCLSARVKIDWNMIFRIPPLNPWYSEDLKICFRKFGESIVPAARIFPVAIRSGDEIHPGNMTVALMQLPIKLW